MDSHSRNFWRLFLPTVLLLLAVAALAVDLPIAETFRLAKRSAVVRPLLGYVDMFEIFGHGLGVVILLVAVHQLDPGRRWALGRLLICAMAAGGMADLLKMLVLRTRPYNCPLTGSVWSTFGQWFPLLAGGSPGQSFPSAHTATAAGLAVALTWLYPQGRFFFPVLVVLVGYQRMLSGMHFLSDVLVGAAAGCLVAQFFVALGPLPAWLDRWEKRWRSK